MSYTVLPDDHHGRGDLASLSLEAQVLYGISLTATATTEGYLTPREVAALAQFHGIPDCTPAVAEILDADLWREEDEAYFLIGDENYHRPKGGRPPADGPAPSAAAAKAREYRRRRREAPPTSPVAQLVPQSRGFELTKPVAQLKPPVLPSVLPSVQPARVPAQEPEGNPPAGYHDQGDGVWMSPDGSLAWTAPEPTPGAAQVEVRLRRTAEKMQKVLHDHGATASFRRLRALLTEHPEYTAGDLEDALRSIGGFEGAPKDVLGYITTPYEADGIGILERVHRRRVSRTERDRHQAVRDQEDGEVTIAAILANRPA